VAERVPSGIRVTSPVPDTLSAAFALPETGELISFVGGGGKTSLMMALAQELAAAGRRVIATTTTRIAAWEAESLPAVWRDGQAESALAEHLRRHGLCMVLARSSGDKAHGVPTALPGRLLARPDVDVVLVEADGAQRLPVKAPADHEPALPPETTLLVPIAGIDALDGPIAEVAHRPHLVARLAGAKVGERLTPAGVARLLTHAQGGLKSAPPTARAIPFINKVETAGQLAAAEEIARLALASGCVAQVVVGAAQRPEAVRAVVRRPREADGP